ncbi:MAG: signal recognition particle protein, partial [Actinobacteria bacterium]|nr:signal recognition particle protein [Actinomycetota bacterium]
MFAALSDRLASTFKGLRGKGRLSESDIDATVREIRTALLEADVALSVVQAFCAVIKERALSAEVSGALNPAQQVIKIVNEELIAILGGETRPLVFAKQGPTVILLTGLQGAGKTTLAGKLAKHLASQGHTPVLVAADLKRPNAVDQLRVVGERAGVPTFAPEPGNGVGDPVAVATAGKKFAVDKLHDVVIVDSAGRLAIDNNLMTELADVREAVQPENVLFVVDAMIGQDAVNTAREFERQVGFDAVVLTKLDGDARGGAALSIVSVVERPIMFGSTGEKLEDFEVFHPDRMASRILDMGDLMSLIEQAEQAFDAESAERFSQKVADGEDFTLDDFLEQMQAVKKMGSIGKLMGMLPGMGDMKAQLDQVDERELDRVAAIIQSMTPAERANPKILNGSRRA